jgi:hypothetical protein
MPTIAFVGLDVSQDDASCCFLLPDGSEPVPRWTSPNTQPLADTLATTLAELAQVHQLDQLRIGMEASGLLWWHLACSLKDAPALAPFAPRI